MTHHRDLRRPHEVILGFFCCAPAPWAPFLQIQSSALVSSSPAPRAAGTRPSLSRGPDDTIVHELPECYYIPVPNRQADHKRFRAVTYVRPGRAHCKQQSPPPAASLRPRRGGVNTTSVGPAFGPSKSPSSLPPNICATSPLTPPPQFHSNKRAEVATAVLSSVCRASKGQGPKVLSAGG